MSGPIVVIGATSGTGRKVVEALLAKGQRVRVGARNTAAATALYGSRVQVAPVDVTEPGNALVAALQDARAVISTVGVTRRPAGEDLVRATEYEGVVNLIRAARSVSMTGRFVHMSTIGLATPTLGAFLLNRMKRNCLSWRRRAIAEIRASDLSYTVVQAGRLVDDSTICPVLLSEGELGLSLRRTISRTEAATLLVESVTRAEAANRVFNAVRGTGASGGHWDAAFAPLRAGHAGRPPERSSAP